MYFYKLKRCFIFIIYLIILLINNVNSYYIVIDLKSTLPYNSTSCGLLNNAEKKLLYPPCNNFYDAGKMASELQILYDKNGDFLTYLFIVDGGGENNEILIQNDSMGELNYFCNINFVIVDKNLNEIKSNKIPKITIDGSNVNQDFIITNEEIIYYKCSNITLSMNNFNFINWNSYSLVKINLQENSIGFNRTIEFTDCIFNNSNSIVKTVKFSNSINEFVHKKLYFNSCLFNNISSNYNNNAVIETSWTDVYFSNSTIQNSKFKYSPFLLIENKSIVKFSNTSIINNNIKNQFIILINDVDLKIDQLNVYNNTLNQFLLISNNYTQVDSNMHYYFKRFNFTNNIFKSKFDNLPFYLINLNDTLSGQQKDYQLDNNHILIRDSIISNNNILNENQTNNYNLLYVNSNCRIKVHNSIIGQEFNDAINASYPFSIAISNSNIQSLYPIISYNTTIYLFNNTITNHLLVVKSTIINSNTSFDQDFYYSPDNDSNKNNSNGGRNVFTDKMYRDNNNKLILIIVLSVGIPLTIISSTIIIYFIKKTGKFNHKKKEEFQKDLSHTIDLEMNEFDANVDNVDAQTSTEDLKKKINFGDDDEPESD